MTSHGRPDLRVIEGGRAQGSDATTRTRHPSQSRPSPVTGKTDTPRGTQSSRCDPSSKKTRRELRVLLCGSRTWEDHQPIALTLGGLFYAYPSHTIVVAHGAAQGADTVGADVAHRLGMEIEAFPADWEAHGRRAGFLRNKKMVEEFQPHIVLAFSESPITRGTAHTVDLARKASIDTYVVGHAPVAAIPHRYRSE